MGEKRWEVSVKAIYEGNVMRFKVTRRILDMHVAESKFLDSWDEVLELLDEWS